MGRGGWVAGRTEGVAGLEHEALDDSVEDDALVVAVARMRREILHRLGALVREQLERYVALSRVDDCPPRQHLRHVVAAGRAVHRANLLQRRLLIEHVPVGKRSILIVARFQTSHEIELFHSYYTIFHSTKPNIFNMHSITAACGAVQASLSLQAGHDSTLEGYVLALLKTITGSASELLKLG